MNVEWARQAQCYSKNVKKIVHFEQIKREFV